MKERQTQTIKYGMITLSCVLAFLGLFWMFTGHYPWKVNVYHSFALQAESWLQGRLDLGRDYPHLELAIYEGKYYVSFPPFPSYLLLPFALFFGSHTPDHWITLGMDLLSAWYLFRLGGKLGLKPPAAMFETLFVLLASNVVFLMLDGSVWFFAQMLCFLMATASIYYALCGAGGLSLFCWAGAVGCRPMQALYLPVLLALLYQKEKREGDVPIVSAVKRRWYWILPPGVLGASYMLLNFLRFGNALEFGHNYLPEFVRAEHGQFSLHYFQKNFRELFMGFRFEAGKISVNSFGSLSLLIVSPIFVVFLLFTGYCLLKKDWKAFPFSALVFLLSVLYLGILLCHRTLGGWHFGNRYTNDLLPWVYLATAGMLARHPRWRDVQAPFFIWGFFVNVAGTLVVLNGW